MEIQSAPSNSLLAAALRYAALGYSVFPTHDVVKGHCSCDALCPSPGKHPRTARGFHDSTTDTALIENWWRKWPSANIGIDCGKSGLLVADVDVKSGKRGELTIQWFIARSSVFSETPLVSTPTGGWHYYFIGSMKSGQQTLGEGIDVRSMGGYVLAPPSVVFGAYDEEKRPVPGSQRAYAFERMGTVLPFPPELIPGERAIELSDETISFAPRDYEGPERPAIPYGEHRNSLLHLSWHLRSVQGLTVQAALPIMRNFVVALDRHNSADPFSDREIAVMLKGVKPNIAKGPPATANVPLHESFVSAETYLDQKPRIQQDFIPGLIIQGELHIMYGDPASGKTTIAAYELALISRQGQNILVSILEDEPRDFALKFMHSGGDVKQLTFFDPDKRSLLFPKDSEELDKVLASREFGAIYFDSINDLKSTDFRTNAADEARALFGPLSHMAQKHNVAIICTAHTNKQGPLEGAQQIRAKARVISKISRPTIGESDAINFAACDPVWTAQSVTQKFSRGKSGRSHNFIFASVTKTDLRTGDVTLKADENGLIVPDELYYCKHHEEIVPLKCAALPSPQAIVRDKIAKCLADNPQVTVKEVVALTGAPRSTVHAVLKRLRAESSTIPAMV